MQGTVFTNEENYPGYGFLARVQYIWHQWRNLAFKMPAYTHLFYQLKKKMYISMYTHMPLYVLTVLNHAAYYLLTVLNHANGLQSHTSSFQLLLLQKRKKQNYCECSL